MTVIPITYKLSNIIVDERKYFCISCLGLKESDNLVTHHLLKRQSKDVKNYLLIVSRLFITQKAVKGDIALALQS